MADNYPSQLVGWVVWGKVRSLPWWPGQVMHPNQGPPEVRKQHKPGSGKLLVMFLGKSLLLGSTGVSERARATL